MVVWSLGYVCCLLIVAERKLSRASLDSGGGKVTFRVYFIQCRNEESVDRLYPMLQPLRQHLWGLRNARTSKVTTVVATRLYSIH